MAKGYAQRKFVGHSCRSLHCLWEFNAQDLRALPPEEKSLSVKAADRSASNSIIRELFHSFAEHGGLGGLEEGSEVSGNFVVNLDVG